MQLESAPTKKHKIEMAVICAVSWTGASLFATQFTEAQGASEAIPWVKVDLKLYIFKKAESLSMQCIL